MLKQRIITAAILIPVVVALLFFLPPPAFCLLSGCFILAAAYEWTSLMQIRFMRSRILYLLLMLCAMVLLLFFPVPLILMAAFLWWLLALVMVLIYPRGAAVWKNSKAIKSLMGALVLLPCWLALNYIRNGNNGIYVLLFVFILIWGADSAAYFVGKQWGKTKLAPLVSPGKSIQGALGAIVFATVITLVAGWFSHPPLTVMLAAIALSILTVVFSILGDLFESMLKREAGLKDSGNILPGHGGLLDRIDSLTAAAPVYALGGLVLSVLFS